MKLWRWKNRFEKRQEQMKAQWFIASGCIVSKSASNDYYCCPLTMEFDKPLEHYPMTATLINLEHDAMAKIVAASDKLEGYDSELRAWLLETCGIKEEVE